MQAGIFDAAARIGRLRFLTYCTAILALLTLPGLLLCTRLYSTYTHQGRAAATLIFTGLLIFAPALYGRFTLRRLHDLDRSGWWACLYSGAYFWLLVANFHLHSEPPVIVDARALVPALCNLALFMALALVPGSDSDNRFGPPVAANSISLKRGAIAWILLCATWISIPVIRVMHHHYVYRESIDQSVQRVVGKEVLLRDYFRVHKAWPDPINDRVVIPVLHHTWYWRSRDGSAFVIDVGVADYDGVVRYYPGGVDLVGVAVWSTDGGESWHCGPYGIALSAFPDSCRELGIPAYTGPM